MGATTIAGAHVNVTQIPHDRVPFESGTLDVASLGLVEITSEDEAYPIENALPLGDQQGWRAAEPGAQIIRLLFDEPQKLSRIASGWFSRKAKLSARKSLYSNGRQITGSRSERLSASNGISAPLTTVRETEDYTLDLSNVTVLELTILPDRSGGDAHASTRESTLSMSASETDSHLSRRGEE